MTNASANWLADCGLPIFFHVTEVKSDSLPFSRNPHGQSVRVWARSLSVMQKEAIALSALTGKAWRLASDEGPYLDGFDAAPCPLSFLSTGMVSSYMNEILALARQRDISVRNIVLMQDNYYTMEGSALRGTMTGGALPVDLEVRIDSAAADSELHELVTAAVRLAPIQGLLAGVHKSAFSLRLNGHLVALEKVRAIEPLNLPDPAETLARCLLQTGREDPRLIERTVAADAVEGVAGGAHSSLKDAQSRKLHVRVICSLRPDGVKVIDQELFNPLGSKFRFLSDEAEGFGGSGLAPDAASYLAAGIAFCFMTQLGRYAKIVKKNLDAYNVIQDAHFSLGGASGGTGQPGQAEPIETHVYLTSSEDDAFARKLVQMGEQTCFLHAFCRTDLHTDLRVTRSVS